MGKYSAKAISWLTVAALVWGILFPGMAQVAEAATIDPVKLIWQTPIAEGTTLYKYTKSYGGKNAVIYVTKVDLNNEYVEVKPVYGTGQKLTERQTVTKMANEAGAVMAVNADFFNTSKRGAPFGVVVKDGETVSSMGHIPYWYSLGITSDKTAYIENFDFAGKVTAQDGTSFNLRGINKEEYMSSAGKSHQDQLNLYTPKFGKTSLGPISGYKNVVEIIFVDGVAKEVRVDKPAAVIPYNGFVLWGHGAAATYLLQHVKVGSTVKVDSTTLPTGKEWEQVIGGHLMLVNEGKPITNFTVDSYILNNNARTAVGTSQDGKTLYIVSIDHGTESRGVSLPELAYLMVELGAYRASNFDGGGSTTLSARMLGDTQAKLINRPKDDGYERRVPTGLAVFNTAPAGALGGFQITGNTEVLLGQTTTFGTKAYDVHYNPYVIKPGEIEWQAAVSDTGTFTNHLFTALKPGKTTVTARVGGIAQSREINVISGSEVQQVLVSPSAINLGKGQTITLDVKVKTKKGQTIQATPLSVTLNPASQLITTNDKLQVTAGNQEGKTSLTVSYDGVNTTVPVNIGGTEQPWLTFDNMAGMNYTSNYEELKGKGSFTAVSGAGEQVYRTAKAAKLVYDFNGAPTNEIRITYGRLGEKPQAIPGQPFGLGLWVYGDNSNHWLRAEVVDSKGKTHYVDLAKEINWTGWKEVRGYFPAEAVYPLQLRSIYVVNAVEGTENRPEKGTLYFDEAFLLLPYNAANIPAGKDVTAAQPGKMSLGYELDLGYSFVKAATFLDKARIDVNAMVGTQLPGYVPADYSFTVKPVALKPGQTDQIATTPAVMTLTPKKWSAGKGIGLLYVNEANQTYDALEGQMDEKRNWHYAINAYGTYIPYYLDKPKDVPFLDIINHPAKTEIMAMYNAGSVKGLEADIFGPEVALTRAQYVTLLARVFNWELPSKPSLPFKDAVPAYAQGAVQVAISKGLVKGYPDKTFRPDQKVTRAEAAAILDRVLKKTAQPKEKLADKTQWPSWAAGSINNIVGLGLMDSVDGKFLPNQPTTRAVFVVALYRTKK
ncbi:phosphodiester glycosidase family protein [Brevibacillus dissolubilis]|uniref:phosphodiester glycosidase family protein n=1 Tax=Brevibacillus dissolubilis TaxID=1844116 RepID=UPI0011161310|nr:phosphodiester glycosidase family protein [Brevibacillus dissolubilis]